MGLFKYMYCLLTNYLFFITMIVSDTSYVTNKLATIKDFGYQLLQNLNLFFSCGSMLAYLLG